MVSTSTLAMLRPTAAATTLRPTLRPLSSSAVASSSRRASRPVDLVGPPDPLSNIRPVLYAPSSPARARSSNSPYSSSEFPDASGSDADAARAALELRLRLHRERVDAANHRFWAGQNANYAAQLARRLDELDAARTRGPAAAAGDAKSVAGEDAETEAEAREEVLATFYRDWQVANRAVQAKWVRQWWADVWTGIKLQGKVHWARATSRAR
ncbi:hypothetical protein Q5752_005714 [Cryptotrichosporon argae]